MDGIEIQLSNDDDYARPVADVFVDGAYVGLLTHEDPGAPPRFTFHDHEGRALESVDIDRLIAALVRARDHLAELHET